MIFYYYLRVAFLSQSVVRVLDKIILFDMLSCVVLSKVSVTFSTPKLLFICSFDHSVAIKNKNINNL